MSQIIYSLVIVALFAVLTPLIFSEETPKLSLLHQDWKEKNLIDSERFIKQQTTVFKTNRPTLRIPNDNSSRMSLEPFAEILWNEKLTDNHTILNCYLRSVSLEKNSIFGYPFPNDLPTTSSKNPFPISFQVDPDQFTKPLQITPRNELSTHGHIYAKIMVFDSYEEAKILSLAVIIAGNMPYWDYFRLYRIDHGPGDACIVHVDGGGLVPSGAKISPQLSDHRVAFIRGNVAVYLVSYYKDFGCMDLAYRLDALLVEQMRKQREEKEKDEEKK